MAFFFNWSRILAELFKILKDMLLKCTLNMSTNLENSALATGLEKVSFHSNPKERQCRRMSLSRQWVKFTVNSMSIFVQSLSSVWFFANPRTAAWQASLSFTISQSLLKLMSIESVMPSNHLIFCCPLLLLPSIFPSIEIFPNDLALHFRWPK